MICLGQFADTSQGPHTIRSYIHTNRTANLESPLTLCFWTVEGNQRPRWKHTQTWGEHAKSSQKGWDSNSAPSGREVTELFSAPPRRPSLAFPELKCKLTAETLTETDLKKSKMLANQLLLF